MKNILLWCIFGIIFFIPLVIVFSIPIGTDFHKISPREEDTLGFRFSGRFLIQTEALGEVWYVHPKNRARYRVDLDAVSRNAHLFLGVRQSMIEAIRPHENQGILMAYDEFSARDLAGWLLMDTENDGEVWYVEPDSLRRYPFQSKEDILKIIKKFGKGISNFDVSKIPLPSNP